MKRLGMPVAALLGLALLTGCADRSDVARQHDTQTSPTASAPTASPDNSLTDCPTLTAGKPGEQVAVDYGDFLQAHGQLYLPDPQQATLIGPGAEQFRVRCSFTHLNTVTHLQPPPARDGDASYLPAGTPVYAVQGYAPDCRLAARLAGEWHVYLARDPKTPSLALDCARAPATADPASPEPTFAPDCPVLSSTKPGSFAAVDYVDFVNANGQQYVSVPGQAPQVTSTDQGALQLRVRCTFSLLNDRTHQMTPAPRDGDAGFLVVGTPVYAVKGWSPKCRVMAVNTDAWQLYVAAPEPAVCKVMPAANG